MLNSQQRIDKILSKPIQRAQTSINRHLFQPQPIEQTIFMRSILAVYGNQKNVSVKNQRRNLHISTNSYDQSVLIKNLKRVFSTKSNTTNTTTSPSIKKPVPRSNTQSQCFRFQERPKNTHCRIIESQNQSQKQRYSMLHYNFIKLQKMNQCIYGIPINEFFNQHKFLSLINQNHLLQILKIFDIDGTDIYEIVTFAKYQAFQQFIIWKDKSLSELTNKMAELFQNMKGGELMQMVSDIIEVKPYKFVNRIKVPRDVILIQSLIQDIQNVFIQDVLVNGNFQQTIDLDNLKQTFLCRKIDVIVFIDLITGQI